MRSHALLDAKQYLREHVQLDDEQTKMIRALVVELEKHEGNGSIKKPKARPKYLAHSMPKVKILKDEDWSIDRRDPTLEPEET